MLHHTLHVDRHVLSRCYEGPFHTRASRPIVNPHYRPVVSEHLSRREDLSSLHEPNAAKHLAKIQASTPFFFFSAPSERGAGGGVMESTGREPGREPGTFASTGNIAPGFPRPVHRGLHSVT